MNVSFGEHELESVDDAAQSLEQTRSYFVTRAAIKEAAAVLGESPRKPRVRKAS